MNDLYLMFYPFFCTDYFPPLTFNVSKGARDKRKEDISEGSAQEECKVCLRLFTLLIILLIDFTVIILHRELFDF